MKCPKCEADAPSTAVECPSCGVVMAKVAEAMDRALLRRHTATKTPAPPPQEKTSPMKVAIIMVLVALFAYGAWSWYTDDTESDLNRLAAEVRNSDAPADPVDGGRSERFMWRTLAKFGVAVVIFASGYLRLKSSLSP
jgi:hypothetical protein